MAIEAGSQTQVCNTALVNLGESKQITSIADTAPLARIFASVWGLAVEEVLVDHPWNVALARQNLAVSADYVPAGSQYEQAFEKPADCLRWLPWSESQPDYFEGEEEGRFILSNAAAPLAFRYIKRVDEVALWTPGMRRCLSAKLARMTAKSVTGQTVMIDRMQTLYEETLASAKRQDGAATGPRARQLNARSSWLDARNKSWSGGAARG